jgi:D-serine deaminase-like pyridoxal phosphate-dependent protein
MLQPPPAQPGMSEDEIDTPALVIDLDAFEYNLDTMAAFCAESGVKLRAHAKTHKSPVIALLQMARGAVGQCVQKVAEAEALACISRVAVCVDDPFQVAQAEAAAEAGGTRLSVLVEIDAGGGRCGVAPGPEAVALAERIAASKHLIFGGIQAYHGGAQHLRTPPERERAIAFASDGARRTVEQLRQAGLDCPIVGGAGTGTFGLEAASGVFTELQAGSYCFMDVDYARNLDENGRHFATFRHSLFVLATVMSAARPGVAVVDAGLKALATDSGLPDIWSHPDFSYVGASDEHGKLSIPSESAAPKLGEKLRLVPGHCDPTVDRYDWYVGVRGGRVESLWPVAARGGMA